MFDNYSGDEMETIFNLLEELNVNAFKELEDVYSGEKIFIPFFDSYFLDLESFVTCSDAKDIVRFIECGASYDYVFTADSETEYNVELSESDSRLLEAFVQEFKYVESHLTINEEYRLYVESEALKEDAREPAITMPIRRI